MTILLAGLGLGIAGGAHCVGMCGPLIAAVSPRGWRSAAHHAGRSATYLGLGLVAGVTGAGVTAAGMGRWIAWIGAAWILSFALIPRAVPATRSIFVRSTMRLLGRTRDWSQAHPRIGTVAIGALNGLLPCGLVYAAVVTATATGSIPSGLRFMLGFSTGTTTMLMSADALWVRAVRRFSIPSSRLTSLAYVAVAVLLVWRGWAAALPPHAH